MPPGPPCAGPPRAALRLWLSCVCFALVQADSPSAPVNVTVRHLKANSAVVSWDVLEDEVIIGFAISQQKKDVRMLRFIQEVNTTTRSCALWDLEEDTEYIVHVQAISIQGQSPASEPLLFKTPREAEKMASKNKDEVTMKEMGRNQQLRTGEVLIIVVVLFMWAGVIALFCRQYDIIKDNEPNNNKEKTKSASETSTPEHQGGGLLRSKIMHKALGESKTGWSCGPFNRGSREAVGLPAFRGPDAIKPVLDVAKKDMCGVRHTFANV
ncbi:fibronectin type III domain-containing protein 5 [Peromyscus eremicus]|uniref:fibronectin type III domain-containing protein 5 n=1 Tax=Peromyscus eremicus TaxID=42410 RepID=UPI0027DD77FF|nr:fibronectin type III domain-containing protein 5 [Peromyscus eremicus]